MNQNSASSMSTHSYLDAKSMVNVIFINKSFFTCFLTINFQPYAAWFFLALDIGSRLCRLSTLLGYSDAGEQAKGYKWEK